MSPLSNDRLSTATLPPASRASATSYRASAQPQSHHGLRRYLSSRCELSPAEPRTLVVTWEFLVQCPSRVPSRRRPLGPRPNILTKSMSGFYLRLLSTESCRLLQYYLNTLISYYIHTLDHSRRVTMKTRGHSGTCKQNTKVRFEQFFQNFQKLFKLCKFISKQNH